MLGPLSFTCLLVILLSSWDVVKGEMTFYAVAVGQGDSAIIQCPNNRDLVIVDMGAFRPKFREPDYVTTLLKKKFNAADTDTNIHIVVTHPHADHYNLFSKVLDSDILPNVRSFILGGKWSQYTKKFRKWLQNNLKNVYTINDGKKCFGNSECTWTSINPAVTTTAHWQFCPSKQVKFTVLGANIGKQKNSESVILKIQYKSWSMLMSGDFEEAGSQGLLMEHYKSDPSIFKSNYYKVAHHGAWTKSKQPNMPTLLQLIQPQRVYISHGYPQFRYHHPKSKTISNLKSLPSIATIDPLNNSPFVYWDKTKKEVTKLNSGLDRAIYETCRFIVDDRQVCQDIEITTDGKTDSTKYVDGYSVSL